MSEMNSKVNMSLDEIIKMEQKRKKEKMKAAKGARGGQNLRGQGARGRATHKGNLQKARNALNQTRNKVQRGFVTKKYKNNQNGSKTKSNLFLNRNTRKAQGKFANNRNRGKVNLNRNRSRSNLAFAQTGFFTPKKVLGKRTNSMPNLQDPLSVHNRLGYQSPAQIAYRNKVKRAKQLLNQRQQQKSHFQSNYRNTLMNKPYVQRATAFSQQVMTSPRNFTGGMRSDVIMRAQRRNQYEQKLMRINTSQMNYNNGVNFMCNIDPLHQQQSMSYSPIQARTRQLPRGRSPFRQNLQNINQVGRTTTFGRQQQPRSRSHSQNRGVSILDSDMDDRSFSEVMYSLSGRLGITDKTLNERFSY